MKTVTRVSQGALAFALAITSAVAMAAPAPAPEPAGQTTEAGEETIIITGTRSTGFKASDSPAPIQVLGADALKTVGQTDLVQALAQILPSAQVQAFGSDQAAFHPAVKLRGLSPNHTLVLIDGKRRHGNPSVVVAGTVFGGSAAPDLSLIPQDAIERIEVLQDGAAAQYGTDAIAGVMNFIMKKRDHGGSINLTGGKYFDQGGKKYDIQGNVGLAPFEGAYLNLTGERRYQGYSFRGDYDPRVVDTGVSTTANTGASGGRYILARFPGVTSRSNYPEVNQIFGDGRLVLTNLSYNFGWQITPDVEYYSFGTYSHKNGRTFQNFRLPNVVFGKRRAANPGVLPAGISAACLNNLAVATCAAVSADLPYQSGFAPQELTIEKDWATTVGLKGEVSGTTWDLSSTYGIGRSSINVINSANAALYYDTSTTTSNGYSPTDVHNGDFIFSQWTNTLDLTHEFDVGFAEPVTIAGGLEYRREVYQLKAGELASYYVGSGVAQGGIQSFFGYAPSDASRNFRHNFSQYLDIAAKPIDGVTLDAAIRHEHYDDFGDTTVYKLTGRYDLSPAFAIRGTASTGFRAPTLAEGFYSGINVSVSSLTGIFPANSAGAAALGISSLKPEKSTNFSAGFVAHPVSRLTVTLDAYSIEIKDRIVRSSTFLGASSAAGAITSPSVLTALRGNGVPVDSVLAAIAGGAAGSVGINFFVNGVKTLTQGVDLLASYSTDLGDFGHVDWSLSGNYNKTKIKGVSLPPSNVNQAQLLFDVYAQADLTKTTPKYRATFGANWSMGIFSANLRESYYGSAYSIISTPTNGSARERLSVHPAFITDLDIGVQIAKPIKISIGANNLFNKYPAKYPDFIREQQRVASSTGFIAKYPSFSAYGVNGGYYYARIGVNF
ncbi:TonB-dependent receptor [Sphingomonas naphthae]|uniref:TonB-dependent receptor n=1 Tax=Sphingomonas naphthae TaxID=1813468 RepID=A0ABY7TI62_9SPHN|nr:TonB-dependent receptor [Sphingomonas naphthae]WCT72916.1 TonB-dependent receptor [Sphingomonas naphthae]